MAKGKRTITISSSKQPPLTAKQAQDITFTPPPSLPLDHERNQPSPTGKQPSRAIPASTTEKATPMTNTTQAPPPTPVQAPPPPPRKPAPTSPAVSTNTKSISDADLKRLFPHYPDEIRNSEQMRSKAYYYKEAERLGKSAAQSELSLLSLAENTVDGSVEGALTATDDYADATRMFSLWNDERAKIKDKVKILTDDTIKNKARQLNWFIKLGSSYGAAGKKFFNDVRDLHNRCASDMMTVKDMRYTAIYENLNHIVRQQMMKFDKDATVPIMDIDTEAFNLMLKRPEDKKWETNIDLLVDAYKALDKANGDRTDNPTKNIPGRVGFHDQAVIHIMQQIHDYAQSLAQDDRAKFFKDTAPAKRGKKKDTTPTPAATTAPIDTTGAISIEEYPLPDMNATTFTDEEGNEHDIPEGHYVSLDGDLVKTPAGYYITDEGELLPTE
jgi:hypothetical protein